MRRSNLPRKATLIYGTVARPESATPAHTKRLERQGYFVVPTVYRDVSTESRIAREEIFGPVAAMIRFESEDAALRLANDTRYGSAVGIWTERPSPRASPSPSHPRLHDLGQQPRRYRPHAAVRRLRRRPQQLRSR
jgi:aldehyde dehydrogenase family protein